MNVVDGLLVPNLGAGVNRVVGHLRFEYRRIRSDIFTGAKLMRIAILAGVMLMLVISSSQADESTVPQYDVEGACRALIKPKIDSFVAQGGNADFYAKAYTIQMNGCVSSEQSSYNELNSVWSQIPIDIKTLCLPSFGKVSAFRYEYLKGCAITRFEMYKRSHTLTHFQP